jgi:hypothetical protein
MKKEQIMDENNAYKQTLNKLIAADDLNWCEIDKKYVALSKEELDQVLMNGVGNGFLNEQDLMKIVNWATNAKVGQILLKNYLENKIVVKGFDDVGDPLFGSKAIDV